MGVREVRMNFSDPTEHDDAKASLRFRVGSRWVHEDGRTWVCSDATVGAAVWDLVAQGEGPQGPAGNDGTNATPITSITDDGNGNLTIYTSETSYGPFALKGVAGTNGNDGSTGAQGDQGPQGPAGNDATPITNVTDDGNGNLTIYTSAGTYGPFALKGTQGSQGPQGEPGSTGAQGDQGAQGPQGDPGGPAGPQGNEGPQGPQGPQGDQGPQGPAGAVNSITGTANQITVGGTAADPILSLPSNIFGIEGIAIEIGTKNSGLSPSALSFVDSDSGMVILIETPNTGNQVFLTWPSNSGVLLASNSSLPAANLTGTVPNAQIPATITGKTSISSTTFVGALTGVASGNLVAGGALGTPSSGVLTNCTGLPATGLANNAVTLAKMATGTAGNLISYDATGTPVAVVTGTAGQVLTSNGAGLAPTMQTVSSGTKTIAQFTPRDNQPPATAFATLDTRNSIAVLDFDTATEESAIFAGVIPEGAILTSGLLVRITWTATTATSGACRWGVQWMRLNTDIDADSYDTATEVTTTTNATSGITAVTVITCTAIDGLTVGDAFRLRIYRDTTDAADTMAGDAEFLTVEVRTAN